MATEEELRRYFCGYVENKSYYKKMLTDRFYRVHYTGYEADLIISMAEAVAIQFIIDHVDDNPPRLTKAPGPLGFCTQEPEIYYPDDPRYYIFTEVLYIRTKSGKRKPEEWANFEAFDSAGQSRWNGAPSQITNFFWSCVGRPIRLVDIAEGGEQGEEIELDEYEETIFPEDVNYDELLEDWSSYGEIVENAKMLGTISGPVSQIAGAVTTVGGLATTGAVAAGFGVAGAAVAVFAGAAILSQEILKRRYKRFFALHTALSGELAYAYINETDEYVSTQGVFRKLKNQGKKIWENIDREGLDYSMWVERNPGIETALVCIYHEAMHKNPVNNPKLALEGLYELAKELYSQPPPAVLAYDVTLLEWQQGKIDDIEFYKIVGAVSHHPSYSTNWAAIPSAKAAEAWKKITGGELPKLEDIYFPEEGQHAPYAGGFYRGGNKDVPRGKYPADYWREINSQLASARPGKEETDEATEGGVGLTGAETGMVAVSELKDIVEGARMEQTGTGTVTSPESNHDEALLALESWVEPTGADVGWGFGGYLPTGARGVDVVPQGWDGAAMPAPSIGLSRLGGVSTPAMSAMGAASPIGMPVGPAIPSSAPSAPVSAQGGPSGGGGFDFTNLPGGSRQSMIPGSQGFAGGGTVEAGQSLSRAEKLVDRLMQIPDMLAMAEPSPTGPLGSSGKSAGDVSQRIQPQQSVRMVINRHEEISKKKLEQYVTAWLESQSRVG